LRITDCCTAIDDAVAIAAFYRALVCHAVRQPHLESTFCPIARALTEENRWRAQRYGIKGTYIDIETRRTVSFGTLLDETLSLVHDDAVELGLDGELTHLRTIAKRGTSAQRQLEIYERCRSQRLPARRAMQEVAKWLRVSTEAGSFWEREFEQAA